MALGRLLGTFDGSITRVIISTTVRLQVGFYFLRDEPPGTAGGPAEVNYFRARFIDKPAAVGFTPRVRDKFLVLGRRSLLKLPVRLLLFFPLVLYTFPTSPELVGVPSVRRLFDLRTLVAETPEPPIVNFAH